jgi:hypothetical protein
LGEVKTKTEKTLTLSINSIDSYLDNILCPLWMPFDPVKEIIRMCRHCLLLKFNYGGWENASISYYTRLLLNNEQDTSG